MSHKTSAPPANVIPFPGMAGRRQQKPATGRIQRVSFGKPGRRLAAENNEIIRHARAILCGDAMFQALIAPRISRIQLAIASSDG